MKKLHTLLSAVLLIVSCKEEVEKPKVIYDAANKEKALFKMISQVSIQWKELD
jgi:hypothetical protein